MLNQNQATDKFTHLGGTHGSASGHYCNITLRGRTTSSMVVWFYTHRFNYLVHISLLTHIFLLNYYSNTRL